MTTLTRGIAIGLGLLAAATVVRLAAEPLALRGACYCQAGAALHCTGNLTEQDCRRQCNDALCDEWFWKERLPCWNWGYGG